MHITTCALVLRSVDYRDSDNILTLFTQELGIITASARGCRKKGSAIASGCQLLAWSELVLYDYQGRWSVKEAAAQRLFQGVRDDIVRLALGRLQSIPPLQVKTAFEWRALCLAGYEPAVDLCPCCAASPPEDPRFHILEGTVHCARCRDRLGGGISMPLSPQALSALQYIVHGDPKRLFSFHLDPASLKQLGGIPARTAGTGIFNPGLL